MMVMFDGLRLVPKFQAPSDDRGFLLFLCALRRLWNPTLAQRTRKDGAPGLAARLVLA